MPANANVNWTITPSSALTFTQGNPTTTFTKNGSFSGIVTISGTVTSPTGNCGVGTLNPIQIWVGKPKFNLSANNNSNPQYYTISANGIGLDINDQGSANFSWTHQGDGNLNATNSDSATLVFYQTSGTVSAQVTCTVTNSCGSYSRTINIYHEYCPYRNGCGGGGRERSYSVYPNPSSNEITVSKVEAESNTLANKSFSKTSMPSIKIDYEIINTEGYLVGKGAIQNNEKIQVSKFDPGVYMLRLITEDLVETKQIIIN